MSDAASSTVPHPAPHRHRAQPLKLAFGLLAGPAAWALQMLLTYGLASQPCYLSDGRSGPAWFTLAFLQGAALVVSVAAAWVVYGIWRETRHESGGHAGHLVEIGEGRTRFLALVGLLTSIAFAVVVLFDIIALLLVPSCAT